MVRTRTISGNRTQDVGPVLVFGGLRCVTARLKMLSRFKHREKILETIRKILIAVGLASCLCGFSAIDQADARNGAPGWGNLRGSNGYGNPCMRDVALSVCAQSVPPVEASPRKIVALRKP